MARRIRYNRASIDSTINAAKRIVEGTDLTRYIYATAYGFTIDQAPPPFSTQRYVKVTASSVEKFEPNLKG